MRRILFTILIGLAAAPSAAWAQVQLGAFGGAALATFTGDDADDAETRTSPTFGATLVWQPASAIGFETGMSYVPKGASASFDGGRGTLKIGYLEIPALLRLAPTLQGSQLRPVVQLGGALAIKTSCEFEAVSGSASLSLGCEDSVWEGMLDLKSIDFGLRAGFALDVPLGETMIVSPGASYTLGLLDIGDTSDNADIKNSVIQLGVGVRFRM